MGELSVCRIFLLQRKPKLGNTKPSTGPHAACGLDIAALANINVSSYLTIFTSQCWVW